MDVKKSFGIEGAKQARGITVIVDIFRAATVAAFLLDKGVREIIPVATKEEAFKYKKQNPSYVLVGEEMGHKIEGFDLGNSPFEISRSGGLRGKIVVHRTTMGTQGIVNARNATEIIFGSFSVASAIEKYLNNKSVNEISIIAMDGEGTEDDIFADYLIAKLKKTTPKDIKRITSYLKTHPGAAFILDPKITGLPKEDFGLCLDLDRFDFVPLLFKGKLVKHG